MQIRDAKIDDYNQIYDLNLKHNLRIPDKNEWEKIWTQNPNFDFREDRIGWVIEDKKKIKGFLGYIKKKYTDDEGKEYDGLVSHNWVVDNDCRNMSLILLNKFFTDLKFDIYINSTASLEVAKVWEALGAKKVPVNNIQSTLFIPINTKKVAERISKNNVFNFFIGIFFKFFIRFKILSLEKRNNYKIQITNATDIELKKLESSFYKKNFIREKVDLNWYQQILSKNNTFDILKIYKRDIMVGYCLLITSKDSKFNKTYVADIKINEDFKTDIDLFKILIKEIFTYAKKLKSDLIQIKYLDEEIYRILKKIIFLNKNYNFCSFYYYTSDQNLMVKLFKKKWIISMLSGDSFLI